MKKISHLPFSPKCCCRNLLNFLLSLLPDSNFASYCRLFVAHFLGIRVGGESKIRRLVFFGDCRNIVIGSKCCINREVFLDGYDKITIDSGVGIGFRVVFITSSHEVGDSSMRAGELVGMPITIGHGFRAMILLIIRSGSNYLPWLITSEIS